MDRNEWLFLGGCLLLIVATVAICLGMLVGLYMLFAWAIGSFFGLIVGAFVHAFHLLAG
jgi:uncharacterized membrane protein